MLEQFENTATEGITLLRNHMSCTNTYLSMPYSEGTHPFKYFYIYENHTILNSVSTTYFAVKSSNKSQ